MICSSALFLGPNWTRPQGSVDVGKCFIRFGAGVESKPGSTRLLINGAFKVICRPPLHAGEAMVVKSPVSICGVGMNSMLVTAAERTGVTWTPPKKNNL